MVTVNDYAEIKEELVVFLRNQDIYTTTQRGVTTTTATGTWSSATSQLINKTNVRNIRSITVDGTPLAFGTDYTVDYSFSDTTIKCKISLVAAQTGDYIITYDYGTDKIFPSLAKNELTISSFPRIGIHIIGDANSDIDMPGDMEESVISFTVAVYDKKTNAIDATLKLIRAAFIGNKKAFYYLTYVRRLSTGPLLPFNLAKGGKVYLRAIDYLSPYNFETTT